MDSATQRQERLARLLRNIGQKLNLEQTFPIDASAWFLGPKAENREALHDLINMAIDAQVAFREQYMRDDPRIFDAVDGPHEQSLALIKTALETLLDNLQGSIPMASYRNQSHMNWDITLPGIAGYVAAMLYNQNNVAAEASPVTTLLEMHVGKDLCRLLGFGEMDDESAGSIKPWGHITCDGSIANGEAMWAARNLKYLPVALAAAIFDEAPLAAARDVSVMTYVRGRRRLLDLSTWELLNLPVDVVIGLVDRIASTTAVPAEAVRAAVDQYSVQSTGLTDFWRRYLDSYEQASPHVMVPATAHYSWPKSAALLGMGTQSVRPIKVDLDGRMDVVALRQSLDDCLKRGRPVLGVVAVLGSTEEGAVDPLAEIVRIRDEYRQLGMEFVIHVDGAWGGYFNAMLRAPEDRGDRLDPAVNIDSHPHLYLSDYFKKQFGAIPRVDSFTLDPHKSGYIPYPAGGLCYRNGAMRDLIAFTAPVVYHGGVDVTVGPYGIEGSKPGAAAASVYLSHKVIPLTRDGYGRLLGRCLFNNKRFYAALVTMDLDDDCLFTITPFQRLPAEKQQATPEQIHAQKQFIRQHLVACTNDELINEELGLGKQEEERSPAQKEALTLFQAFGSDLSIVAYAFNFRAPDGVNRDLALMNELNDDIYRRLSLQPNETGRLPSPKMFVTASSFDPAAYGTDLIESFADRAGVVPEGETPIKFLISTTQNPWLTSTVEEHRMLEIVIEELKRTVNGAIEALCKKHGKDIN